MLGNPNKCKDLLSLSRLVSGELRRRRLNMAINWGVLSKLIADTDPAMYAFLRDAEDMHQILRRRSNFYILGEL